MVHPAPDSFVGHHDTAFRQQIFDVAKAQGKPDVKPDRLLDDFQRMKKISYKGYRFPPWLLDCQRGRKPESA
jgi:hypothetical protein